MLFRSGRRVRVRRFELAPLALRKEAATWNRHRQKKDRRSTREGARRGRAGVVRSVAAVRTFWVVRHLKVPI